MKSFRSHIAPYRLGDTKCECKEVRYFNKSLPHVNFSESSRSFGVQDELLHAASADVANKQTNAASCSFFVEGRLLFSG